jgi:FkbM family methyltransferase
VAVAQLARRVRALVSRRLRRGAGHSLVELPVPGSSHAVWARSDTSDLAAFRHVFDGAYDFELPAQPRLILDLGANVGYGSVYFALRHPTARVIAVEPEPSNVALLRRNVAALQGVDVVEAAVWPRSGRVSLQDPGKGQWGMRVHAAGETGHVRAVTITELLERTNADWIDLAKIDIEGSERELFSQNTGWLERVGALVLELHDRFRPGCRDALDDAIARSGVRFRELHKGEDVILLRDS